MKDRLKLLERRAHHVMLPDAYTRSLYTLRNHIALMRRRIEQP